MARSPLANREASQPFGLLLAHLDALDLRAPRPLPAEGDQPLDRLGLAFEDRLDRAVPVVAHPPGYGVLAGESASTVSEEHALDLAVDDDTTTHVRSFVHELARARIGATFNQYAASPFLRERLAAYLDARRGAPILLVGEAAGYRGARVSGIAFTSERQLTGSGPAEASATIVHRMLAELGLAGEVLLWNVVPTHPGTATSNRRPTRAEVSGGLPFLERLARGRRVVAVGRLAQAATGAPYVRHPARGGARRFRDGLIESLA